MQLGLGYNILKNRIVATLGSIFINAATAAGYSGGSATCADDSFNALSDIA